MFGIGMLERVKSYSGHLLNRYFPSVRGIVLLIVLPATIIVTSQFFYYSFVQFATSKDPDRMVDYEKSFAPLKKDLPSHAFVNYVSNKNYSGDYFSARYVLIPVRLVRGLNPQYNYLVVHLSDPNIIPQFDGYTLKKDYDNGIILFTKGND